MKQICCLQNENYTKCPIIKSSVLPLHGKKNPWYCTIIELSTAHLLITAPNTASRTNTRFAKSLFLITYPDLEIARKQQLNSLILADAGFS